MRFDRRFALVAVLAFTFPALGWGNERTWHDPLGKIATRNRQAAEAKAANSASGTGGQIGSFAVDANSLLAGMDVDPSIVISPVLTGDQRQGGVFPSLGALVPSMGTNFSWLSSGIAGAGTPQTVDPAGLYTEPGWDSPSSCASGGGYDCITLGFSFNVPAGMYSIHFDFNFMSVEYPEFVNLGFNDSFIVSLSSPSYSYPNVVFDSQSNPINIDSAFFNQPCSSLSGTGFDLYQFDGSCDAGATGLLTTDAPVAPGETVVLTFTIRDNGDGIYDSAVLLDNFQITDEVVDGPQTSGGVTIDYLSPKSGPLGGGTSTLIHGEGFENVAQVSFGGIPALYNVLDEFTIQAITPPHSEGAVDVAVTATPGNSASTGVRPGAFIYYLSPEGSPLNIISVDPPQGPKQGGVAVAVRGSGFKSDTIITFDGEAAVSQEFINGDEIVVITPNGSGAADVRAVNPDGTDAQLDGGYVFLGDAGDGGGANGFTNGACACSLDATGNPASSSAAPLAIAGMVIAAWLVRRLGNRKALAVAALPATFLAAGCNDSSLAPVNSAPIADAGPSAEAFVGTEITLDGTESKDFEDGSNLTFMWEIVTKPVGSIAELDDPSEKTPSFSADMAGLYRIGLVVRDSDDIESGPIGFGGNDDDNLTDIVALPFRDLQITLSWDTDDSDLDLHLIRPNSDFFGGYWSPDYDCFYGAPDPEWGSNGIEADNPLLAQDVDTGMGPEQIALASPQDSGLYRIYVHVFNQHGAAPANATVTISVEGDIIGEVISASPLSATDTVWKVGTLAWPDNVFVEDNTFTNHTLLGGPAH